MEIPGLDAPTWSRAGPTDAIQEAEEEERERKRWEERIKKGEKSIRFVSSDASSSSFPLSCDLLMIGAGNMASAFIEALINTQQKENEMKELARWIDNTQKEAGESGSKEKRSKEQKQLAFILQSPVSSSSASSTPSPSILFALNYLRPTAPQYADLTQALFDCVKPKQVLILDTIHAASFLSTSRSTTHPPLLRRIQTSHVPLSDDQQHHEQQVNMLESPNLVQGLAAAILTQCEVEQLPAQLFVSLESRHYVAECFQAFEQLFPSLFTTLLPNSLTQPSSLIRVSVDQLMSLSLAARTKKYNVEAARLKSRCGYTAGQDSSVRETASEVTRDHVNEMFC